MLIILFVLCLSGALCQDPLVNIKHGALKGKWEESTKGRKFAGFWGIPYAKPPIGEYRFREPQPLTPWLGVWDATRELSHCLQWEPTAVAIVDQKLVFALGAEDCLFLNVFTPDLEPATPLPVVVYIHSGAFMFGAGSLYGPAHLMDKDLVVVTINYRLGPLGFLSTGDDVISGNAGLKDQAFALKWVQENIREFGGDPNSVTLTGCSAGSASVHYQYLSPMSKGTFHRGIAFSGSAFAPWAYAPKPAKNAKDLARLVGCPHQDTREMAECLRLRPGEVIINAMVQMFDWHAHMFTPFLPTLEVSTAKDPFITEYPYFAAQAGAMHRLPLVATMTAAEGLYPAAYYQKNPSYLQEIEDKWEVLCSNIFVYNDTATLCQRPELAKRIKEEYLGGKPVNQETYPQLVEALGDRHFGTSIARLVTSHARTSPTYMYKYNHRGEHSLSHHIAKNKNYYGVSHADDIMEIFQFLWTSTSDADVKMRVALLDMIYTFASTGVPKFPNAPEWAPVKPNSPEVSYLEIFEHDKYEVKSEADIGRQQFWDSLGLKEYNNYHSLIREEL